MLGSKKERDVMLLLQVDATPLGRIRIIWDSRGEACLTNKVRWIKVNPRRKSSRFA